MRIVAVLSLARGAAIDAEAPLLAADLGVAAYDARLLLAAGEPAIVLSTRDVARATALVERLRARGHDAIALDATEVVPSSAMVIARRPAFDGDALAAGDADDARLPWDDVAALVRATHRRHVETETETRERRVDLARAAISGGLVTTRKVVTSETTRAIARDAVLYVFRRSGATPWLLRETGARYDRLPPPVAPSQVENFRRCVDLARRLAPHAAYDERLLARKRIGEETTLSTAPGTTRLTTSSEPGVDLLAHLVARALARRAGSPYRDA